jgi:uncharacterized membrane protein
MASKQNRNNRQMQAAASSLVAAQITSMTSGPLPSAEQLGQYEVVSSGAADRIIRMAESQSSHRIDMERSWMKSKTRDSLLGIVSGFVISLVAILSGAYVVVCGHDWPGTIIGGSGIVGLAAVFVYGTRSSRRERDEKREGR